MIYRGLRLGHLILQMQAIAIGGPITYLNAFGADKTNNVDRWRKEVGAS